MTGSSSHSRFDELHRVLGLAARLGDHRGAGFALPARALDGDRVLRRRLDSLQVREHRHPGRAVLGHRASVEDADDPGLLERFGEIELADLGVGVRAAEEGDVRKARKAQIVDEGAAALQQALRVGPRHALADVALVDLGARRMQRQLGFTH